MMCGTVKEACNLRNIVNEAPWFLFFSLLFFFFYVMQGRWQEKDFLHLDGDRGSSGRRGASVRCDGGNFFTKKKTFSNSVRKSFFFFFEFSFRVGFLFHSRGLAHTHTQGHLLLNTWAKSDVHQAGEVRWRIPMESIFHFHRFFVKVQTWIATNFHKDTQTHIRTWCAEKFV